jgi:Cu(I)/Ag(I) efflux system membrane fusion protein
MFVNVTVKAPMGEALVVPVTAVMDTGKRQLVWVEVKEGMFEPRDVKVGTRMGDSIQILSGLKAGELVASSGGYLIDSEAQLKGGAGGPHEGHGGTPGKRPEEKGVPSPPAGHEGHEGHEQPSPKKNGMGMDDMKM